MIRPQIMPIVAAVTAARKLSDDAFISSSLAMNLLNEGKPTPERCSCKGRGLLIPAIPSHFRALSDSLPHPAANQAGRFMTSLKNFLRNEWVLLVSVATVAAFWRWGDVLFGELSNPLWLAFIFVWLFGVVMGSALAVVRHADHVAEVLGEPYGTLVLTLSVTAIEVMSISAVMLHGANNPTLVRDTLFAIVMIILGGMVGASLLVGGWRHREQHYNLQGANAYLSVIIPLAVLTLSLPNFTVTTPGPTLSIAQQVFLVIMSVGLYCAFLAIQTGRHRGYFTLEEDARAAPAPRRPRRRRSAATPRCSSSNGAGRLSRRAARASDRLSDRDAACADAARRRRHRHAGGDAGGDRRHARGACANTAAALDQYFPRLGAVDHRADGAVHAGDQLFHRPRGLSRPRHPPTISCCC